MTLRQKIEARARQRGIDMYDHPEDQREFADWWDNSGNDMMKEDLRESVLEEMLDEEA